MLKGTLDDFTLSDICRLISMTTKTGRLEIVRSAGNGKVYFRDGEVYYAESSLTKEPLGQKLIRSGSLTEGELRKALDLNVATGERVGEILLKQGVITNDELVGAVKAQIEDAAFDLLRWETGDFHFEPHERFNVEIQISVSVENLIMEASRRLDELEVIKRKIPSLDVVLGVAPSPPEGAHQINITPEEWRVLVLIDGIRNVGEVAAMAGLDAFGALRTLYGLVSTGLVDVVSLGPVAGSTRAVEREAADEGIADPFEKDGSDEAPAPGLVGAALAGLEAAAPVDGESPEAIADEVIPDLEEEAAPADAQESGEPVSEAVEDHADEAIDAAEEIDAAEAIDAAEESSLEGPDGVVADEPIGEPAFEEAAAEDARSDFEPTEPVPDFQSLVSEPLGFEPLDFEPDLVASGDTDFGSFDTEVPGDSPGELPVLESLADGEFEPWTEREFQSEGEYDAEPAPHAEVAANEPDFDEGLFEEGPEVEDEDAGVGYEPFAAVELLDDQNGFEPKYETEPGDGQMDEGSEPAFEAEEFGAEEELEPSFEAGTEEEFEPTYEAEPAEIGADEGPEAEPLESADPLPDAAFETDAPHGASEWFQEPEPEPVVEQEAVHEEPAVEEPAAEVEEVHDLLAEPVETDRTAPGAPPRPAAASPRVDRAAVVRELASLFNDDDAPRRLRAVEQPGTQAAPSGPPPAKRRVEDDDQVNKKLIGRLIDGVKGL